ncbi:MAG: TlpA family protein disulfide reductase [Betaproteobacteria bacterium]|nr:TlpA family protein disulfide reductase [Betaproteobacteria bacterium]
MSRASTFLSGFLVAIIALAAGVYTGYGRSKPPFPGIPKIESGSLEHLFASRWVGVGGDEVRFAKWRGKTLVVNFWATWCPPCREEMPGFSRLQRKHEANGVQFVGIALDTAENVQEFSKSFPVDYPLLIGGSIGTDLTRKLGNLRLALPYTLVVTTDNEVRFARPGAISERELGDLLDNLLRQRSGR